MARETESSQPRNIPLDSPLGRVAQAIQADFLAKNGRITPEERDAELARLNVHITPPPKEAPDPQPHKSGWVRSIAAALSALR